MVRLHPRSFFRRFHASIATIYGCLRSKLQGGRYDTEISRSRQRHWLLALRRQVAAYLGEGLRGRLVEDFERL